MFVAWRDLRFAKGRFALMGAVVVLITLLVVALSGLTAGLGRDSASAIADLPADRLVLAAPTGGQQLSFADSALSARTVAAWREVPGVERAEPLGVATAKARSGARAQTVTVLGVGFGSPLAPERDRVAPGRVLLSTGAARALGAHPGAAVEIGGERLTVASVAAEDSFSHTPVVWADLGDWHRIAPPGGGAATAIALRLAPGAEEGPLAAADRRLATTTVDRDAAREAIPAYRSEHLSLELMRALMFAISALVVGAFFTVWTIQRSGDVAILKALGASTGALLRDALGQALVILLAGTALGTALAGAVGLLAGDAVPFVVDAGTTLAPAAALVVLGLLGAAVAIRRLTSVDPLTALGSAR
jgi:putative ABC transport system permease protein